MITQNAQVLIVWVAFTLMVILSYFFVGRIVRSHLVKEAEASLTFMQTDIEAKLEEIKTCMLSISETIRSMVQLGYDSEAIQKYIIYIADGMLKNERYDLDFGGVYGAFHIFADEFLHDNARPAPDGYIPGERPWYKTAVAAKGEVAFTQPFNDAFYEEFIISCVRQVFDDDGNPLFIFAFDVPLDKIVNHVASTKLADGGYGVLFDRDLIVIAHPDSMGIGRTLRYWSSGLADLAGELETKKNISERRVKNFRDTDSIVSIRSIKNQWYLGIVTPYHKYYQDVNTMMIGLILVGFTLAAGLSVIFIHIASEKTKAEVKNQQKSSFLARMSHEIRTPMNAILGIAEIQLQDESIPQSVREAFYKINTSGDLLIGIINDILDLSKIEAGKLELTQAKYDVPSLINDTVQLNVLYYESKQIDFKLFVDENVPLTLIGDELHIKQILNNLLSNAFKYTERGEVSLTVTAEYMPRGGSIHVPLIFRVSDTGQGMTTEQIRRLGDEYSRFNMEANRTTEGTGLGMSIAMKLIQMMDGEISVESRPGRGTTITVRLPQRNVGLGVSGTIGKELAENLQKLRIRSIPRMKKVQMTRTPMPYGKVLIVDDVESNLYVAQGLLTPYGLSIETAKSGFEAIEKIKGGAVFDIIFMDHMMPKMDGIEAVKIIRGLGYSLPIIALTANALSGMAEIFSNNGFDGFISKPIDIRQLNASLNKFIRDRYPAEVVEAAKQQALQENLERSAAGVQPVSDPELAAIFVRDAEKAIERLDAIHSSSYRSSDDIRMFVINVHAMKSALANIGETELSAVAFKLEQAGRDEDIPLMTDETPAFLEALREVIEKNKVKGNGGDTVEEDSEYDRMYLGDKLLTIQKACEEYDEKTASAAIAELRQIKLPRSVRELLDTITGHLLHSDFEDAANLAKAWEKAD
jgi:signal transduction histidine kinase/CheY-like chemotaxis protein